MSKYVYMYEDSLVRQVGNMRHGKRVSKDCKLGRNYRRMYVTQGVVACVRLLRTDLNLSISEAIDLLNAARYAGRFSKGPERSIRKP